MSFTALQLRPGHAIYGKFKRHTSLLHFIAFCIARFVIVNIYKIIMWMQEMNERVRTLVRFYQVQLI
jgi:hypothetical protein